MQQIVTLKVDYNFGNGIQQIYPVILKDDNELILIDCGYPGFLTKIKSAADTQSIDLAKLTKIIITHHDFDHMGALADFKKEFPHILIGSSELEEKYISGKEKSLRLQQAENLYDSLSEEQKPEADSFHRLLRSIKTERVDILLKDGDKFPWCGGVEIIATPGHMPGHISIYVKSSKTLITGDALVIENDELSIANPQYTLDLMNAKESIRKLQTLEIEKIICYHGGEFTGDIKQSIKKILLN